MTDKTGRWLANAILGIYDTSVTPAQLDEAIAAIELYAATIRAECAEVARKQEERCADMANKADTWQDGTAHNRAAAACSRIATAIESMNK